MANYFNFIDDRRKQPGQKEMKSYIVLGEAMPEGSTVYVLRKKVSTGGADRQGSIELWAPLTGECYFFEEKQK